MKPLILTIATVAMFAGFVSIMGAASDRQATVDCLKWQNEATQYKGFYITKDEEAECQQAQITINAPVK